MNLIITNKTVNTTNLTIHEYSKKISIGDNKNLLYTLPSTTFETKGWKIICYENFYRLNKNTMIEKIQTYLQTTEKIDKIFFFRANTLISLHWEEIKNLLLFKIIYVDDLHNSREIRELKFLDKFFYNYFDIILSTYAYCFKKYFNYIDTSKLYWFPHSFNQLFNIKYNKTPKNKILLSGCISNMYPMRQEILKLSSIFPIDVLEHPKYYENKLHDIIGKKFIEKINEYKFAFTCCLNSDTPYLVQKFFEIPGAGSLLICYDEYIKEQMKILGFVDMYNYISVDKYNLEDKLLWIFDPQNDEEIEKIRLNGYNFINSNHTHEIRTINFLQYLNTFDSSNLCVSY